VKRADKAGNHTGDTKRFREEMERLGFPFRRGNTGNFYVALRIQQDQPEQEESGPF
jgi:hypothetical protein